MGLRSGRHKMLEFVKKEVKNGFPEDAGKKRENTVEGMLKEFTTKIDNLLAAKEKEIMTV